jgi:hypothetical protein
MGLHMPADRLANDKPAIRHDPTVLLEEIGR